MMEKMKPLILLMVTTNDELEFYRKYLITSLFGTSSYFKYN